MKNPTPRWSFLRRYRVQSLGITYLTRFALIQTPWFGIWLHAINRDDNGASPHNHPWTFRTLVLRGGYIERLWPVPHEHRDRRHSCQRTHERWSWMKFEQGWAHQIEKLIPGTITLVFVGKHTGEWGFFTWSGYKKWDAAPQLQPGTAYKGWPGDAVTFRKPGTEVALYRRPSPTPIPIADPTQDEMWDEYIAMWENGGWEL